MVERHKTIIERRKERITPLVRAIEETSDIFCLVRDEHFYNKDESEAVVYHSVPEAEHMNGHEVSGIVVLEWNYEVRRGGYSVTGNKISAVVFESKSSLIFIYPGVNPKTDIMVNRADPGWEKVLEDKLRGLLNNPTSCAYELDD